VLNGVKRINDKATSLSGGIGPTTPKEQGNSVQESFHMRGEYYC